MIYIRKIFSTVILTFSTFLLFYLFYKYELKLEGTNNKKLIIYYTITLVLTIFSIASFFF